MTDAPQTPDEPTPADPTTQPVTDDPTEAVETVLAEMAGSDEPLNLAIITDEELYAYCETPEEAAPHGMFFGQLSEEQQQAASAGAMRALAARGLLESELGPDGAGELELPTATVAAVALRRLDPQVSLRVIGTVGDTWYLLRYVRDGIFLRESVTSHGFHLLSLVRLDDDERDAFLGQLALPESAETATAPDVDLAVSQAQLEGAEIGTTSKLDFLASTATLGNLIRVPDVDGITTSMIHVLESGQVIIGEIDEGRVRYRGATVEQLRTQWASWAEQVAVLQEEAGQGRREESGTSSPPEGERPADG